MNDTPTAAPARMPLLLLFVGGIILAYGQVILAPLAPAAAWSGVLDSAGPGPGPGRSLPGSDASTTITLHLRGVATGRTFSVPAGAPVSPELLHRGDTVRVLVGWGTFRDLPGAIALTSGGTVVIDSAQVLRAQRTQRGRVSAVGGIVLLAGLALLIRHRRQSQA